MHLSPPLTDHTRQVILLTPGGMQVIIPEENINHMWRMEEDEQLARAYALATGLPATVHIVSQTTVHPVKAVEA